MSLADWFFGIPRGPGQPLMIEYKDVPGLPSQRHYFENSTEDPKYLNRRICNFCRGTGKKSKFFPLEWDINKCGYCGSSGDFLVVRRN